MDSGLAFNSPYPLLLRPQRDVDIFLSFDFSARKKDDESPFQVNTLNIELVCKTRTPKLHIPGFHTFLSVECYKSHFVAIKKLQIPRFWPNNGPSWWCCRFVCLMLWFVSLNGESSLGVWRFKPLLSAGLRFHSYLSGGLRLRDYLAVAGNQKFRSRFSVFACSCGGYSNRVKRLGRLSGNFVLLKASLFNERLLFKARPSQSGLPSVSPAMWAGVRS